MNKEKAREILQDYFNTGLLPIYDSIAYRNTNEEYGIYEEYTFRELLCIAYDLKPTEDENTL